MSLALSGMRTSHRNVTLCMERTSDANVMFRENLAMFLHALESASSEVLSMSRSWSTNMHYTR